MLAYVLVCDAKKQLCISLVSAIEESHHQRALQANVRHHGPQHASDQGNGSGDQIKLEHSASNLHKNYLKTFVGV